MINDLPIPYVYQNPTGKIFEELLTTSVLRGVHSTGIFAVSDNKVTSTKDNLVTQTNCYKRAIPASDFVQLRKVEGMMKDASEYRAMVGHVRHATKGGITDEMAHPFRWGHITMVHNGTLNNHTTLVDGIPHFQSDSEALCWAMANVGAKEALEAARGAFAVIWHDAKDNTLNFCRNDERPLYFTTIDKGKHIVGASESSHLRWILTRNNADIEEDKIWSPHPHTIFSYSLEDITQYNTTTIEKPKYVAPIVTSYNRGYQQPIQLPAYSGKVANIDTSKSTSTKKQQEVLDSLGVAIGDRVAFWPHSFAKYSEKQMYNVTGSLEGMLESDPKVSVVAHGLLSDNVWNYTTDVPTSELFTAEIIGVSGARKRSQSKQLIVRNVVAVDWEDYYNCKDTKDNALITIDDILPDNSANDVDDTDNSDTITGLRGPNGEQVTSAKFLELVAQGCALCGQSLTLDDADSVSWLHPAFVSGGGSACCEECVSHSEIQEDDNWSNMISHTAS